MRRPPLCRDRLHTGLATKLAPLLVASSARPFVVSGSTVLSYCQPGNERDVAIRLAVHAYLHSTKSFPFVSTEVAVLKVSLIASSSPALSHQLARPSSL